jgi:hypothetical protein
LSGQYGIRRKIWDDTRYFYHGIWDWTQNLEINISSEFVLGVILNIVSINILPACIEVFMPLDPLTSFPDFLLKLGALRIIHFIIKYIS